MWSETALSTKRTPPLQVGVIVCYTVVTRQLPPPPSALYPKRQMFPMIRLLLLLLRSPPFSFFCTSCAPNIAHIFVYVVGNYSKSKPALLPSSSSVWGGVLVVGLSAATTCQPPWHASTAAMTLLGEDQVSLNTPPPPFPPSITARLAGEEFLPLTLNVIDVSVL